MRCVSDGFCNYDYMQVSLLPKIFNIRFLLIGFGFKRKINGGSACINVTHAFLV